MTVRKAGVWLPDDRAESIHRYVPVQVPAGATGLSVELEYDRAAGVLDLGMFDPAGQFRGYSGGARDGFTIGESSATPGYLPGELVAGVWNVYLRLHRVSPEGLPYAVSARLGSPASTPLRSANTDAPHRIGKQSKPVRDLPTLDGLRWYAGDLHSHTVHSDGFYGIEELAAAAVAAGLDFLAVTDHNTTSHHPYLSAVGERYGISLLPGQEVTTDRGHANAFGDIGWIDFREPAATWVSTVAQRGGLLSVNHPLAADCAWRQPLPIRPPLAEVWHSGWWDRTWGAPLAWLLAWDHPAQDRPATILIGGSDFHHPDHTERLAQPTTWVLAASPSTQDILAGIAAGRTSISGTREGPLLLRTGEELAALDGDGLFLTDQDGRRRPVRGARHAFPAVTGPLWLEDGRTEIIALCA